MLDMYLEEALTRFVDAATANVEFLSSKGMPYDRMDGQGRTSRFALGRNVDRLAKLYFSRRPPPAVHTLRGRVRQTCAVHAGPLYEGNWMRKKLVLNIGLGLPLLLAAYLCTVAAWSATVVDEVFADYPVPLGAGVLSPSQQDILLKIEDPTFFQHGGVSLANGQGVTTITSSLAREAFLFHHELSGPKGMFQSFYRAVFNCCKKIDLGRDVMAVVLDKRLDKQRQLSLYAQQVYMGRANGRQVRGFEQAAAVYLGKPLARASDTEFAGLVGMIQAPNQYNPLSNRAAYEQRAARVIAVVQGRCLPDGWFDTGYEHCAQ